MIFRTSRRSHDLPTKLPEVARPLIKKLILKAFTATSFAKGLALGKALIAEHREAFPEAMKCLERDLEECLTVLKFPFAHRVKIRTNNLLERLFGDRLEQIAENPDGEWENPDLARLAA